jgi:hypothetical protein
MQKQRLALIVLSSSLALAGCKKDKPADVAPPAAELVVVPAPSGAADEAKLALTPEKLAAYIKYQQKIGELNSQLLADVKKMDGKTDAGDGLAAIKRRAELEESARKETGLSESELTTIDELVSSIMAKRSLVQTFNYDVQLAQMEQVKATLPPDKGAEADKAIEQIRKQRDEFQNLTEERKKYGDPSVNLVLTKEEELTKSWQQGLMFK